jgi:hypothetical protein
MKTLQYMKIAPHSLSLDYFNHNKYQIYSIFLFIVVEASALFIFAMGYTSASIRFACNIEVISCHFFVSWA